MKVLLTGSTGYIGRRLEDKLLEDSSITLRLFVRNRRKIMEQVRTKAEIAEGDTFDLESLKNALQGIDIAYYLVHSMHARTDFQQLERISAENFLSACIQSGVKRVIYLSGLGKKEKASKHLKSRLLTGEILSSQPDKIQTIWLRAGIIIGSGSGSFEILYHLVQRLPVMVTPKWVRKKAQPVAVSDVIQYLVKAKEIKLKENLIVDIGKEIMTLEQMLLQTGDVLGLKRFIIPLPAWIPEISAYWLLLFTPTPYAFAREFIEALKSDALSQNDNARQYFSEILLLTFKEAVKQALEEIEDSSVISRWCDSSAGEVCDIKGQDNISTAILTDKKVYHFKSIPQEKVFSSIMTIGGERGWFKYNILWEIRGLIDKLVGGYGISRGRRDERELRIGDCLDFWKVLDIKQNHRLLLLAQMKVPGKAWLEFILEPGVMIQTAYFQPKGIWGRLYWYLVLPFHFFVFRDLAESIIKRAKTL